MYLKNIEVNGFKSFANKINFKFEKGITGIVGPNGSGKSNVGDAVRWVLGEQSALKLRGSKMEDVIFSGTELRKPQGSAYVAITLDNSDHSLPIDYNEVTVARRVYRSGESEYLINGNVSRLKDVASLFFDTGVGKEGYSIIGQGQVERIISGKPEERRDLFDEAAGIVKYKKNKLATEKSLETEHANLNRVNDILSGLQDRIEPLRAQSEKAAKYLEYKEELKTYEVNSFLLEVDKLRQKLDENKEKLQITKDDKERLLKEFEDTKSEYERLEEELEELNTKIEDTRLVINGCTLDNERSEGEIRVLKERITSCEGIAKESAAQIERVKGELDRLNEELDKENEKKSRINLDFKEREDKVKAAEDEVNKASLKVSEIENKIDDAKGFIIDSLNNASSLKEKSARYDAMLENISLRRSELKSKFISSKAVEDEAKKNFADLSEKFVAINAEYAKNEADASNVEEELDRSIRKQNELRSNLGRYNQQIISLKSKYENVRNLSERYEGYGQSIKRVMERRDKNPKILGVVADIISVEKEYETAIETALGGSIQNIVTEDEETARDLIKYLRDNKFGRATFLPLTSVKGRGSVDQDALHENGVIGIASELTGCDKKYKDLVASLLGRVIVVDNIDNAIKIERKYKHSLRIVTLLGDLFNPGGAMSGGAFKNSSNLLGRKREMDDLEAEIKKTTELFENAKKEAVECDAKVIKLTNEKDRLSAEANRISIDKNSITINMSSVEKTLEECQTSFGSIKKENEELDKQIVEINRNKDELLDEAKQHDIAVENNRNSISALEKELLDAKNFRSSKEESLASLKVELGSAEKSEEFINSAISRIKADIGRYKAELNTYNERTKEQSNLTESLNKEIEEYTRRVEENNERTAKHNKILDELNDKKAGINENHKAFFSKREELSGRISGLDKAEFTLSSTIEKQELEKDNLSNYMWEEYELTYSSAEALKSNEYSDPNALKKLISGVRQRIKALGEVNVGAIEEFKDVNERYTFLKSQHDDIVQAEENLKKVIADLDRAMKDTFALKFKEIQTMFSKVFKEMFGGGRASLELVDEENLLETGIIINAQPPGKKLQNMMQLSGGEKALTAISLLFAIQSLKPSPFCLLDEIEAALDDSNVKRFANYLSKLTRDTQFIVITHRKGTMECADCLYGITMQEKGVSTLVSVNLIEDKLDN
ncbi:MAG: chromosome segregation protein SMC [Eubacterium sp.]|nr:chromosome segregation protein SMC [Eubacterium sp.]